jgi:hypothetical protein
MLKEREFAETNTVSFAVWIVELYEHGGMLGI